MWGNINGIQKFPVWLRWSKCLEFVFKKEAKVCLFVFKKNHIGNFNRIIEDFVGDF